MNNFQECICCGSNDVKTISHQGRNFKKLHTVMCQGCGLIHSDPIPSLEELSIFYKKNYRIDYKYSYQPQKRHTIRYAPTTLNYLKKILSFIKTDKYENLKFLDIGSGSGELLYFAKKMGFQTLGVEPNEGYANFCKDNLKLNIVNSTYEDANLNKNEYNIVHLNQVLEHLPNPITVLKDLKSYIKENGLLIITVPDIEAQMHSPNTIFHYAHVYNYNHVHLKKIINDQGFEILNPETKTTSIIAQKTNNYKILKFELPKNKEKIEYLISKNTKLKHYSSFTPYKRFLRKCLFYPKEILQSLFFDSHKSILDFYSKKIKE